MINREELAFCKRRGHDTGGTLRAGKGWLPCRHCGIWLRILQEEREDEPPVAEQDPRVQTEKELAGLVADIQAKNKQKPG